MSKITPEENICWEALNIKSTLQRIRERNPKLQGRQFTAADILDLQLIEAGASAIIKTLEPEEPREESEQ